MAQIGTIKLQTQNSGVVDVPVFDTGDSGSSIYEFVRVETASGTGFIPVTDPADATYPFLRVQSQNQGVVAVTDTASVIPDKLGFESGDFSGWSGQLGDWDIVTSPVFEGTFAAQSTNGVDTAIFYEDFPTEQGQIISMRMFGDGNNTGSGLLFGVQDGSDTISNVSGYVAGRQGAGNFNSVELQRKDNGATTTLDSTDQSPPENQWSQHLVEWNTNGDIVYFLKDASGNTVETLTANDTTYTSGYIGAQKREGGDTEDMAVDNFEIVGTL